MRASKWLVPGFVMLCSCAGPQGEPGADGSAGADGVASADGTDGATGSDGHDGTDGEDGEDGEDGAAYPAGIFLELVGRYDTGVFDGSAAEIVTYDPVEALAFVVNANSAQIDVLDLSDPTKPTLATSLDLSANSSTVAVGAANSVTVNESGLLAIAIDNADKQQAGVVQLWDSSDLSAAPVQLEVCSVPDNVVYTPDGSTLLVACEGEPSDDYTVDPEGMIAFIDVSAGAAEASVTFADFTAFNNMADELREAGVRLYGPGASVAEDIEPEYITVSADGLTAWVSLQENNALAVSMSPPPWC